MFIQAKANGTIYPCRFVSMYPASSNSDCFKVIEDIVVAQPIIGVSQEGTLGFPMSASNDMGVTAPTAAALDEQDLKVFGPGEVCLIELGGTVNAGDLLMANATTDGKAITFVDGGGTSTPQFIGGIALQYGVSGEKIRMLVQPMVYTYAA
ncbi:MAG: hypothetical protein PHU85_15575 [Phycisphaerae bacterium]|nr:hypothetical protein [Phycisphaerae bacterium]